MRLFLHLTYLTHYLAQGRCLMNTLLKIQKEINIASVGFLGSVQISNHTKVRVQEGTKTETHNTEHGCSLSYRGGSICLLCSVYTTALE